MKRPKKGGTEGAALPQPHGGGLDVLSDSIDPYGEQAPIIQGLYGAEHGALFPQPAKKAPQHLPLHPVICRLEVHKAEILWGLEASVLVNDVLQHKSLMEGAVLRPVACLSGRSEVLLLCVLDQALRQDASIQHTERLAHCNRSVVSCVCSIAPLEDWRDQ